MDVLLDHNVPVPEIGSQKMLPVWLQEAQIAGTFALGIGAAFLGIQQFRLGRRKFKLELYERRYEVFLSIREMLITVISNDKEKLSQSLNKARLTIVEARFLVEGGTWAYIQELYQTCWMYYAMSDIHHSSKIQPPTPDQWKNILQNEERRRWLIMQIDDLGHAFDKYLIIDDIFGFGDVFRKAKQIFLSYINQTCAFLFDVLKKLVAVLIRRLGKH